MFCQKCGSQSIEGALFCQKCGYRFPVGVDGQQPDLPVAGHEVEQLQPEAPAIDNEAKADLLDVTLTNVGTNKVSAIKTVRELTGLGLKEAMELVEDTPVLLKKDVTQEEAKRIKEGFFQTGAILTFTDREGACVDITLHCKACGAALEDGKNTCNSCGRAFASPPERDATEDGSVNKLSAADVRAELFGKFKKMPVAGKVITVLGVLLVIGLIVVLLRLIFSSLVAIIVVAAGGYFVYYRWGAKIITELRYNKKTKELQLPEGMSPQALLEALAGKFNYPSFKGVRYGDNGECVIDGRYSAYTVTIYDNNTAALTADLTVDETMKRTVMLEGIAICAYINKFFNPFLAVDVLKDVKALKSAERQRKTVKLVFSVASMLVVAVVALGYALPGSLHWFAKPGAEVRRAYLTQYSETVTIEEAFENFFDKPKWSTYENDGYSYVAFAGSCELLGEKADIRIIFKITGEQFLVDGLDVNGRAQNELVLYSLLSAVYENY